MTHSPYSLLSMWKHWKIIKLTFFATCVLVHASCLQPPSRISLVGVYQMVKGGSRVSLVLRENNKFSEEIELASGTRQYFEGTWKWSNQIITFDDLKIPKEMALSRLSRKLLFDGQVHGIPYMSVKAP